MASTACPAGSRYSVCSSSPALGVNSGRKCGSRSNQGPGSPSCAVQLPGGWPGTGFRADGAGVAVNQGSSAMAGGPSSVRLLIQSWVRRGARQSVNMLTL